MKVVSVVPTMVMCRIRVQPAAFHWQLPLILAVAAIGHAVSSVQLPADDWPRWRGPQGAAVSTEQDVPLRWSTTENVAWKVEIPGEGSSSPIVWGERVFVTSALEDGTRRQLHCLDRDTGRRRWTREISDENPEITSSLTGHAAATPATNGRQVVAFFGNAGLVAYDMGGQQLWHQDFDEFESELGIASSPILVGDRVLQLCDHDGKFYRTFDSFLICLQVATGEQVWKKERRGLERSWSTPIVVPSDSNSDSGDLVVNAQDEVRGYSLTTGELRWHVRGMTGWVTPSPVYGAGLIFATSGKDGPLLAIRPGGRGDVTASHVSWLHERGGPYVCSPVFYAGRLYVLNSLGILNCYEATTGKRLFRQRLAGKFIASPVIAAGHLLVTNEAGKTYVLPADGSVHIAAENQLIAGGLASPAISQGRIFLRSQRHLWCLAKPAAKTK